MIVNLERFIALERPRWERLEAMLSRIAEDPWRRLTFGEARELEELYQRASADLARLATFAAEPEARRYLENIVARGYTEIHGAPEETGRFRVGSWLARTLPSTWRRRAGAFWFATALMAAGAVFGGVAVALDPEAKPALIRLPNLQGDPAARVAHDEMARGRDLADKKARFSGMLITHNTQVALVAMALGMTWGIGTVILMLQNGVMLGAVAVDYVMAGQTRFLLGWLLPHGVVELPAMLIGGQAGFVLAGALLGRGQRMGIAARLGAAKDDVVTLCFGATLMLVWAGVVEAFLSQYHEPVVPYGAKMAFGAVEFAALVLYLAFSGREAAEART
ncbi:MAG TPA: stage II sporulation protein M [Opitutaceae bacterium]|nr:stage II sporulation protein M [Solirubrobacteraceae bacterium]HXQ81915.1 stage II sporulation protein M [Opitutaceae bacterium]